MTRQFALALILVLSGGFVATATAQDEHAGHNDEEHTNEAEHGDHGDQDEHDDHGLVQLSLAELDEFGIRIAVAGRGVIENYLELPGEVQANNDRLAHIVPRYSGIVTEVRANIGDYVQEGQVLAVIESDVSLAPFEVKTLISGTVIGKHITLGEAASRERDTFVIADLSSVWIDLTVYQRDLGRVKVGLETQVYIGHDLAYDAGKLSYVAPIVDEHTRTATARLVIPNKNNLWRPGVFVTAKVLVEKIEVPLVVPRTALHTIEAEAVVFLQTERGFLPQPVTLGRQGDTHIEILSGLSAGDHYVSEGGFTLKAEFGKEAFGDGHGH